MDGEAYFSLSTSPEQHPCEELFTRVIMGLVESGLGVPLCVCSVFSLCPQKAGVLNEPVGCGSSAQLPQHPSWGRAEGLWAGLRLSLCIANPGF